MGEKRKRMSTVRKYIWEKLRKSQNDYPQCTHFCHVDTTELMKFKKDLAAEGKNVTITALMTSAVVTVLKEMPFLNARLEGDTLVTYDNINAGIAIGADKGLYVLTLRDAQDKDCVEISEGIKSLVERMNNNTVTRDDMFGSTFTITSLGKCRTDFSNSIINNDECIIVGVGTTKKEPVVLEDDTIGIRTMTWVSVNYNHAITDGTPMSRFCDRLCEVLEAPYEFLMPKAQ